MLILPRSPIFSMLAALAGVASALPTYSPAPQFRGPTAAGSHRPGKLGAGWMRRRLDRHFAERNQQRMADRGGPALRDSHGALTLTGARFWVSSQSPAAGAQYVRDVPGGFVSDTTGVHVRRVRRVWLAGISARRGY